ncbi:YveK family protein [Priestia flexa]|uniref:YveK family protein n=1 Tax=Priestia flexa TaxID=86664 RepID=UPI00240D31A2|nr:Wzz/FepE/Etk N-terminal domain-containing protein [Priestia flexa]WEZ07323.1 Wzz/FepE/Etk N-terminal domain-containing protein [Priestia flexa]
MKNENIQTFQRGKSDKEINLKEYYDVLKKRVWVILIITAITTMIGVIYSGLNSSPLYQTSTRIIINTDSEYMKTLMVMIKDPIMMQKVKEELRLQKSPESIANQIQVTRIDESQVVSISVVDSTPQRAVSIADTTARVFKNEIASILKFKDVQLLSGAKENPYPINESQSRTIIFTFLFGLAVGVGLAFLLDSLDVTLRKHSEIEDILGVPVLGVISSMNKKNLSINKKRAKEMEVRREAADAK